MEKFVLWLIVFVNVPITLVSLLITIKTFTSEKFTFLLVLFAAIPITASVYAVIQVCKAVKEILKHK